MRSAGAPPSETAANLVRSFWAWVTRGEPAWVEEAREAKEEAEVEESADAPEGQEDKAEDAAAEDADAKAGSHKSRSTTSSVRSAKALSTYKRQVVVIGAIATVICWGIFVWCVTPARSAASSAHARVLRSLHRLRS